MSLSNWGGLQNVYEDLLGGTKNISFSIVPSTLPSLLKDSQSQSTILCTFGFFSLDMPNILNHLWKRAKCSGANNVSHTEITES